MVERREINIEGLGILSERDAYDVLSLSELVIKNKSQSFSFNVVICVKAISQSLNYYYKKLKWFKNPIEKLKYKKRKNINWLLKHFSVNQIMYIYLQLPEGEQGSGDPVSRIIINSLISSVLNIKYDEVEKRPITEYRELLNQVFNITNFKLKGKLDFETLEDKKNRLARIIEERKKKKNG